MKLLRHLPRFRQAYRELETLAARETWSRSQIEVMQLERLNAVWAHAAAHVPYYRRLATAADLPPRFASLAEYSAAVPVLPKATVREHSADLLSETARKGVWKRTSGSTGSNTAVFWTPDAYREVLRGKYRFLAQWGLDIFDRTAFLWGHAAGHKPGWDGFVARWRQPIEDWLRNRIRLSAYHLGQADLREHLRRLERFRPALLYAYSTAAYLLAQEAEATGWRCPSLKLVTLTSEFVFPHAVETLERVLGVPAVNEYGSVECGFLAGEGPDRTLRVREDHVLIETQPREDGRHEILVTVLNNPSFPLLRYALGDVTDAPLEVPAAGFARLHNIAGRDNDVILSRAGEPLHPTRFNHIFEHDKAVRRWRIHQRADGSVAVAVEPTDRSAPFDMARLDAEVRRLVDGYPVTVELVGELSPNGAGKHRWILSDLVRPAPQAAANGHNGTVASDDHVTAAS
jgi:phenylacetate-CoA ligase